MALRAGRLMLMAAAKAQQARASTEKLSTKVPKPKTNPSPTPSPIKKEKTGIMLDRPVSTEMGKFCGVSEISRTEAMKKIWVYIKEKDLQHIARVQGAPSKGHSKGLIQKNPENKREIILIPFSFETCNYTIGLKSEI
ncbi:hypothetical protein SUGI_0183300 [Cryptomeria japonica]|nr:hypothetical protein SUGI_0183300 [Cryptomeria japonica]